MSPIAWTGIAAGTVIVGYGVYRYRTARDATGWDCPMAATPFSADAGAVLVGNRYYFPPGPMAPYTGCVPLAVGQYENSMLEWKTRMEIQGGQATGGISLNATEVLSTIANMLGKVVAFV